MLSDPYPTGTRASRIELRAGTHEQIAHELQLTSNQGATQTVERGNSTVAKPNLHRGQEQNGPESSNYVTVPHAARILGVHRNTVLALSKDGTLPARRIGNRIIRVDQADVLKMNQPYLPNDTEGAAQ